MPDTVAGPGPAMIFIHGLTGSPRKTWGRMIAVCAEDGTLGPYSLTCYSYPSRLIEIPFFTRQASLQDLARGLQTEIETFHGNRPDIVLVAHSLGGLVARQYILNCIKANRNTNVSKLVLIAVPHTGSALANLSQTVRGYHPQVTALCKNSDVLSMQNEDWLRLKVEDKLAVRYIVGAADNVVTNDSAQPFLDKNNVSTIVSSNHTSITEPINVGDLRYAVVRNFVLHNLNGSVGAALGVIAGPLRAPDPLFDFYTAADEQYYIERSVDKHIEGSFHHNHVWLVGDSGVGKTSALRFAGFRAKYSIIQIMLGSYQGKSTEGLMRAVCLELAERFDLKDLPAASSDLSDLIVWLRRSLRTQLSQSEILILVEEIPLSAGDELKQFLESMLHIFSAFEADDYFAGRVKFAFSSIADPRNITGLSAKLREKLEFISLPTWDRADLSRLIEMLSHEQIGSRLSDGEKTDVLSQSNGMPRFIKRVFRRLLHGDNQRTNSFSDLLCEIARE